MTLIGQRALVVALLSAAVVGSAAAPAAALDIPGNPLNGTSSGCSAYYECGVSKKVGPNNYDTIKSGAQKVGRGAEWVGNAATDGAKECAKGSLVGTAVDGINSARKKGIKSLKKLVNPRKLKGGGLAIGCAVDGAIGAYQGRGDN